MDSVWTGFVCVSDVVGSAIAMMLALSFIGEPLPVVIVQGGLLFWSC